MSRTLFCAQAQFIEFTILNTEYMSEKERERESGNQ